MTIKLYDTKEEKEMLLKFLKSFDMNDLDGLVVVKPETKNEAISLLQNYMTAYAEGISCYLFPVKYWKFLRDLEKNFDEGYYKRTTKPAEMLAKEKEIIRDCIGTIFG